MWILLLTDLYIAKYFHIKVLYDAIIPIQSNTKNILSLYLLSAITNLLSSSLPIELIYIRSKSGYFPAGMPLKAQKT